MKMNNINDRFKHLVNILTNKNFLECQILCNEVPFFIADYDVNEESEIQKMLQQLIKKLSTFGVKVLSISIYDLIIKILKDTGDWDWYIDNEKSISKDYLKENLQAILDVDNVVLPAIQNELKNNEYDIIFLFDIGTVFPFLRTHSLLASLSKNIKNKPIIMFYPGKYQQTAVLGSTFSLFGKFTEGREYKAANIYEIQGV